MIIKFINVYGKLLHSGVRFADTGALIYNPSLNAVDVGVNFVYRRRRFVHVACEVSPYAGQCIRLSFDIDHKVSDFIQRVVEVQGKAANLVF